MDSYYYLQFKLVLEYETMNFSSISIQSNDWNELVSDSFISFTWFVILFIWIFC